MTIDAERLKLELQRMKELIASDPAVLAHFDADGNGVIDGQEWEAVRQVVIRRLEREAAEAELARQMLQELDDAQAAELARMEADMAAEDAPPGDGLEGRDWGNLELAFDPREARGKSVADEVYERELHSRYSGARNPNSVRFGEYGTLADCQELVLEQGGGAKQLFGNLFRRTYVIRDPEGNELGRVGQRENEALQNLTDYSIFNDPTLNFRVHDEVSQEEFRLERTSGLGDNSISVYNPRGHIVASASWTLSFLRRKYEVRVVREGISYYVRRRALRPWTFEVLDPFEEPIGEMQRGWSGLGFLTGGNLFHIQIDEEVSPDAMWGFLATALLADLDSEQGSRRSGLDFFNE